MEMGKMRLQNHIILYLFFVYGLSLVFTLTEFYGIADTPACWFVFPDLDEDIQSATYGMYIERCVRLDSYVYYFCHHIIGIMFYYFPIFINNRFKIISNTKILESVKALVGLEIVDFIDYLVIYNDTWFIYQGFEMNYNHLHTALFFVVILINRPWTLLKDRYH